MAGLHSEQKPIKAVREGGQARQGKQNYLPDLPLLNLFSHFPFLEDFTTNHSVMLTIDLASFLLFFS